MANSQLISPAICPVSSPSNKPAHGKYMSVRGSSERSDCKYTESVINDVPNVGPDVEIDCGPYSEDYD